MSEKPTTISGKADTYEHPAGPMTQGESDAASVIGALETLPEGGEDIPETNITAEPELAPVVDPTKSKAELEADAKAKNAADAKSIRESVETLYNEDTEDKDAETEDGETIEENEKGAENEEGVEDTPEVQTDNTPANVSTKASPLGLEGIPTTKETKNTVKDAKKLAEKKSSGLLMRGFKKVGGWIGGGFMALFGAAYALYEIVEGKPEKKKDEKKK